MLRLVVDENFNHTIIRGLVRRTRMDLLFVRNVLPHADDPTVLDWAVRQDRAVLTHDVNTMTRHAYDRMKAGLSMAGLLIAPSTAAPGPIIEDLVLMAECATQDDLRGRVIYLPL